MAKGPISSPFQDAVIKNISGDDSDHKAPVYRSGDASLTKEVIGVRISGEPSSDFFSYVQNLD